MTQVATAIVFPGQGSQSVGMLSALAAQYPVIIETFAQASDVIGRDLWKLAQEGPEDTIRQTEVTQPLMYTSGIALWRLWSSAAETAPVALAGHSLGEFCALTASGVIEFGDGIALVNARAQLMAAAVPEGEGGMAAILGMDDDDVVAVCEAITGTRIVEAVNFNSPGQVAISGHVDALQQACALATERGARKAIMLPVSVPNHSSLMRDAGAQLAERIDQINLQPMQIPVVQNAHATVPVDLDALVRSLKEHVYSPVQWTQSYRYMHEHFKPEFVIELGPGKVLAGLGKRIERSLPVRLLDTPDNLQAALDAVEA